MVEGISIREFARRDGCDKTLVRRAIQGGRLRALEDGRLDPALVGTDWRRANAEAARGDKPGVPTSPVKAERTSPKQAPDPDSKFDAERRKEIALAGLREIDHELARGSIVPIDVAAEMVVAEYAKVRTRLISIAAKVASRAAALRSPAEIQALVAAEINEALEELTLDAGGDEDASARAIRTRGFPVSGSPTRRAS